MSACKVESAERPATREDNEQAEGHRERIAKEAKRCNLPFGNASPRWGRVVEAMSRYTADVSRDGRFWLVHVPEIERYTQARNLREIDAMARDLVSVMTGAAPESVEINIRIHRPA